MLDPQYLQKLRYRSIGPTRGGRVIAVAADPVNPNVFYFGAVAGGIWKTDDGGHYWNCVSDGYLKTSAIGALAVAPSDPNVIYAGTGETTIRIDVSHGDGVYKSTDAGQSWKHMGLADSRHIGRIRVHPTNPDLVYAAVLGHAFRTNEERGVYRSKDGGQTWERVLYVSDKAGAVDLSLDPNNPRILFATIWQTQRKFWSIESGGDDCGLWRSTDGGDTWENITRHKGLPTGVIGKIGVAVSPAQSGRVWAIIEAEGDKRGLYRSDDNGQTWEKTYSNRKVLWRPWYYAHVFAHPTNPDTVYIFNMMAWSSIDGGKTFNPMSTPHGDNHDLWIDPTNPQRMIGGDDGGAWVTFNGGRTWSTIYNQPTAQFYHVTTDNQFPYRVYGTQQDNSSISVPSRTGTGAIGWTDCYPAGTGESGYIAVHPKDNNIVFVGAIGSSPGGGDSLQKYDHRTKQIQLVTIWPEDGYHGAEQARYRFQWTYPILFSPHDPDLLYACGNVVFTTRDNGQSWQAISPDLTYADPETLKPSGGPLTYDTAGAEMYATIFAFAECPHEQGVLWAGSDDGLIHLSKDGGQNWTNVTPPDMAKFTQVTMIEPSAHHKGTVYVTAARHKMGDYAPYVYKTSDYGQTWTLLTNGLPADDFCRVVRCDPSRDGLLYVGTELGVYVSFNDGANWQSLQANLPVSPVYDMVIKENDLVVATHGRSFWILDDLTQLHQLHDELLANDKFLLRPRDHVRLPNALFGDAFGGEAGKNYPMSGFGVPATFVQKKDDYGQTEITVLDGGEDLPNGVFIRYYTAEKPEGEVKLAILDEAGELIREYTSTKPEKKEDMKQPVVPAEAGMNAFFWNMRYPDAVEVKGVDLFRMAGPLAPPGNYQVRLTIGDWSATHPFALLPDPRVTATAEDFAAQFALLQQIYAKLNETHTAVNNIRDLKAQVNGWLERLKEHAGAERIAALGKMVVERLSAVESELINPDFGEGDSLNKAEKLNAKLLALPSVVASADTQPTSQSYAVFEYVAGLVDEQLAALNDVVETELAGFNGLLAELAVPSVVLGE
ncbi:MAG: glycosyl hydrolase [Chloroflexi bacterium]|nr:glycosyl hydrolase [Chloroflexota bacterium]